MSFTYTTPKSFLALTLLLLCSGISVVRSQEIRLRGGARQQPSEDHAQRALDFHLTYDDTPISELEDTRWPCQDPSKEDCGFLERGGTRKFLCQFGSRTGADGIHYCCLDPALQGGKYLDPCADGFVGDECTVTTVYEYRYGISTGKSHKENTCQGENACAYWSVYDMEKSESDRKLVCCDGKSMVGHRTTDEGEDFCTNLPNGTWCDADEQCASGNCDLGFGSTTGHCSD